MQRAGHYIPRGASWPALPLALAMLSSSGCAGPRPLASHAPGIVTATGQAFHVVSPFAAASLIEAEIALAEGDPEAAVEALEMALASEPDDPLIRVRLASALLALGKTADAVEQLKQVLASYPDHDMALVLMGDIALAAGNEDEAVALYLYAVQAEPTSLPAYERLVSLYRGVGDFASALEVAERIVELFPTDHDALLTASELALELNLEDEAYELMAGYIGLVPTEEFTGDRRGSVLALAGRLLEKGQYARAMFLFRTLLEISGKDRDASLGMARAFLATGDTMKARKALAGMGDPEPGSPSSTVMEMAELWLLAGDAAHALSLIEAVSGSPGMGIPPAGRVLRVECLAALLRFDAAAETLEGFAPDEHGFSLEAKGALASALFGAGLPSRGWDVLASSPADIPELLGIREVRRALVQLLMAGSPPAVSAQAALACSTTVPGRLVLVEASFMGDPDPGGQAIANSIAGIAGAGPAEDVLVDALAIEATCIIEGLCKANPNRILSITASMADIAPTDPRLAALRGMFYLATGNVDRALLSLVQASFDRPADPLVKLWLAMVLIETGDMAAARDTLTSALTLGPSSYVQSRLVEELSFMGG